MRAAVVVAVAVTMTTAACTAALQNPGAGRAHGHGATASTRSAASAPAHTSPTPPAGGTSTPGQAAMGREGVPAFSHVFVVMMENRNDQEALADPAISALARRYASASAWYSVAHPSLPNYLAVVSGSTWEVTSDCTSCQLAGPNLATELATAGISWGAYLESVPGTCFLGPQSPDALYAQKHNPFAYFDDIRDDPALCDQLQPFTNLTPLLAESAAAVPRFVWVTPNMCDDGHNCSTTEAGAWLSSFVDAVTASAAWKQGGVLFVTWDEGTDDSGIDSSGLPARSGGGGEVLTLVIAPNVAPGLTVATPFDHYSLLRTIEDAFGLPLLGQAASPTTKPLTAFFSAPTSTPATTSPPGPG